MSAASISVQDGSVAAVNVTDYTSQRITPGNVITIALQTTTGINRWIIKEDVGNALIVNAGNLGSDGKGWERTITKGGSFSVTFQAPNSECVVPLYSSTWDGYNKVEARVFLDCREYPQFRARAAVTTLQAYTGSGTATLTETSNGAISAADGVTLILGDVVFIQAGTTNLTGALDSGPWVVTALGGASAKWTLSRPPWFPSGQAVPNGIVIEVDGEGTNYAGTSWKSFATQGSAVIGTNDPAFYVRQFVSAVTLVTGFVKLGPSQSFPGLRATTTDITFTPTNFNGGGTTVSYRTGAYASGGSATAIGYMGTSTVSITALVAAGTFNTNDVGTGLLTIRNW
jgi:hypothetical protein